MSDWDEPTSITDAMGVATPRQTERDRAYLIVLAGSHVGEMFKITDDEVVLGRGRRADVRLVDDGVSRRHAKIVLDGDRLFVEDLGSRNGTFCNGVRVTKQPLEDGDKIQIGRTTILKFTYHDEFDESFQRQMYDSALRDGLTRVFNKRYFADRLESEFKFSVRHQVALSLLMLDIDHFKRVNDEHGHIAGDHVLVQFAAALQRDVRNEDVLARYGGEEFAIISRSIDKNGALTFAERLRHMVETLAIHHDDIAIPVTVSVGIATMPDDGCESALELITCADRALYWAKAQGRNRVAAYEPSVGEEDTKPS